MLYELFHHLIGRQPGAGLFAYISFRAALAALLAFGLGIAFGGRAIRWLARIGAREDTQKSDSPILKELHKDRDRTPTMGGLFIVGAMLVSCVLCMRFDGPNRFSAWGLFLVVWFAGVGLLDDWTKLKTARNGISARRKQGLLTIGAVIVAAGLLGPAGLEAARGGPHLYVPFLADVAIPLHVWWGLPFLLVAILVLTGSANAVNLTDGLDGLATGCVAIAAIAFAGITYFVGHSELAGYLRVAHVPGAGELTVMLGALLGACLAFLWFNAAPALVFMGDVGSLGLGGALGYAALVSRTELVLVVVGGVFVVEALSVVVQVLSFKTRGRRVFRCAPLHHHYQFGGMPESRLVVRAWIVASLLAMSSLALFKVR
ncbi:MAG TPA: phospho-N-acetylmuramoyl-pentapeptide-transferase [Planctomycetota bacterium]|nr:phospho-N-acetylmuramoyl-pentapeptide-transferase [Planctomycetota bacterium]